MVAYVKSSKIRGQLVGQSIITVQDINPHRNSTNKEILFLVCLRAAPAVYRGSQARGLIRATAASLHPSHSNTGSELCLQPTLQLATMLDP